MTVMGHDERPTPFYKDPQNALVVNAEKGDIAARAICLAAELDDTRQQLRGAVDVLRAFPEQASTDTDGYAAWLPAVRDWNERRRALLRGPE